MINFKDLLIYGPIVGVGGSGGGGVTIKNQNKTITENGTYTADSGYTGLGRVEVDVQGGGGGASVYKALSWKGTTVPNEGEVGTVYINNKMSIQQVMDMAQTVLLQEKENYEIADSYISIYIITDENENSGIMVDGSFDENNNLVYCYIYGYGYNAEIDVYTDYNWFEYDAVYPEDCPGWYPDVTDFTFPFNNIAFPEFIVPGEVEYIFGQYNDQLSSLFSITPFEADEKETVMELSGEFDGEYIAVTKKETIDIKTLLEQKKLPLEIGLQFGSQMDWNDYYGIAYSIQGDTCYIFDYNEERSDIYGAPWQNENIKKAVLLEGSRFIHSRMFENCAGLTEIIVPDSVTEIGGYAFNNCTSLTRIVIPDSITYANNYNFNNCNNLTEIVAPAAMFNYRQSEEIFQNLQKLTITSGDTLCDYAINLCTTLKEVDLNLKSIGTSAFSGCTGLEKITLHNTVTTIGQQAFYGCTSLTSIIIPNSVTSIGDRAFRGCTGLTEIVIPDSVTSMGSGVVGDCTNLIDVVCPAVALISVSGIKTVVQKLTITSGDVSVIDYSRLQNWTNLKEVVIGNAVTAMNGSAFRNCALLTKISCPTTALNFVRYNTTVKTVVVTSGDSIPDGAFDDTTNLEEVIICEPVTSIGEQAFYKRTKLTKVVIPKSVTSIGRQAFYNCTKLASIIIPDGVTSIGGTAFWNCTSLTSIVIPESVTTMGANVFQGCSNLKNITYAKPLDDFGLSYCSGLKTMAIPYGTTTFNITNCTGLTSIAIPDTITTLSLANCTSLTDIIIPSSVTEIPNTAFMECTNLKNVIINGAITSIGEYAFYNCNKLTNIILPDTLTSIGEQAFYNCFVLNDIYYKGTISQWNAISKGFNWNFNAGNYTIHCTDGDIPKA